MDVKHISSRDELRALIERQTELFRDISNLDEQAFDAATFLEKAGQLISEKWIYPDTAIEFRFGEKELQKEEDKNKEGMLLVSVEDNDGKPLQLQLLTERTRDFYEEEKKLAKVIAQNVSSKLNRVVARQKMEKKQQMLDKAYKLAKIGTWEYDMINDELYWSDMTKEVHGFDADYHPDIESTIQLFKKGYHREVFEKAATDAVNDEIPFDVELKIVSGKGDERWIRATGEPEYDNDGVCIRFYGISQNVTERRQAEENLEHNERRFKALVKSGMDLITILDEEACYKYTSPAIENVLGFPSTEIIEKSIFDYLHEDDAGRLKAQFKSLAYRKTTQLKPYRFLNSEGQWRWLEATITNLTKDPAVKGYVINSKDVTERQIKQEEILNSLKQKETLLSEVHHRIKNNLSVLTGLLQMQAADEDHEEVLRRLFDSVARINTMASIHEQMYKSNNFSEIEFADRIQFLAQSIQKTFQSESDISLNFQCEPLTMSVSRALPCSLIINEVLTNIYKHAFTDQKEGKITFSLSQTDIHHYMKLTIQDNGKGLPKDFDPQKGSSLGVKLIDMLSEQINAQYFYQSDERGTSFNLLFNTKE